MIIWKWLLTENISETHSIVSGHQYFCEITWNGNLLICLNFVIILSLIEIGSIKWHRLLSFLFEFYAICVISRHYKQFIHADCVSWYFFFCQNNNHFVSCFYFLRQCYPPLNRKFKCLRFLGQMAIVFYVGEISNL